VLEDEATRTSQNKDFLMVKRQNEIMRRSLFHYVTGVLVVVAKVAFLFHVSVALQSSSLLLRSQPPLLLSARAASVFLSHPSEQGDDHDGSRQSSPTIQWIPSGVSLQGVSHSYPDTIWRRLISSVPRREFSIENLNIVLQSEFRLIVGASSSGKSTLLQLILGASDAVGTKGTSTASKPRLTATTNSQNHHPGIQPDSGMVQILSGGEGSRGVTLGDVKGDQAVHSAVPFTFCSPHPILLVEKPKLYDSKQEHIISTLTDIIQASLPQSNDDYTQKQQGIDNNFKNRQCVVTIMLQEITTIFDFPLDKTLSQLSPSESYRYSLAVACLESVMGSLQLVAISPQQQEQVPEQSGDHSDDTNGHQTSNVLRIVLPAPILLLDEWMDTETSLVVRNVQPSLERLVERGGLVLSVTHKPQLYTNNLGSNNDNKKPLTFCRGVIISS
jgi:energy-coupling factor transporter ATP-binding protein EcfA2